MRFPSAGRLESGALVRTMIQCRSSQTLAGRVNTPENVAPAASSIVSPQLALFSAFWKLPPAPAIRYAYATPDCALGTDEVVIASADCVGLTATDALDFFVVSAALVAVTVTLVLLLTVGAVNSPPLEMLPAVADQV